jgi:hypothetical protein
VGLGATRASVGLSGISENAIVGFFFFRHVYVGISNDL